jgi:hypothetical protein
MSDLRPTWLGERTNMIDSSDEISFDEKSSAVIAKDKNNPWFDIVNIQFIVTTHSPFLIQTAREGEVLKLDGELLVDPNGRSIEEISKYVMDVDNTNYSPRITEMKDVALEYMRLVEESKTATSQKRSAIKRLFTTGMTPCVSAERPCRLPGEQLVIGASLVGLPPQQHHVLELAYGQAHDQRCPRALPESMTRSDIIHIVLFVAVFPALWLLAWFLDQVWPTASEILARRGEPPVREHAGKIDVLRWQKWRRALRADRMTASQKNAQGEGASFPPINE